MEEKVRLEGLEMNKIKEERYTREKNIRSKYMKQLEA